MKQSILSLTLASIVLSLAPVSPADASNTPHPTHSTLNQSRRKYSGILPDAYYDQIARCETGLTLGQPFRPGKHSSYTSALGINKQTARRWSGHTNLNRMRPRQLVRIADRIAFAGWTNRKGEYVWPVGPFGWSTVKHGCGDTLQYLCHATHRRVQKYRARACRLAETQP